MTYKNNRISDVAEKLKSQFKELENKKDILKSIELKALYSEIPTLPNDERASFGKEINSLKSELEQLVASHEDEASELPNIDVTAPFAVNTAKDDRPKLGYAKDGSLHPVLSELEDMLDIFYRMGFSVEESRQLDDDFHMFESLNFPEGHPARDDYDTFTTKEGYIAPAHTSTMQHRVLNAGKSSLEDGEPIATVVPGKVFRNEDLDARHEHTFFQIEGIYVSEKVNVGNLIATLRTFMDEYYQKELDIKIQPFYFPFTEPSFEFAISCPFCDKTGCKVCGEGWIELLGCGMIHPNVLAQAGIDTEKYTGFAWGIGFMRMVMIKHNIEDIRHFNSGNLDFLRQFK